MVCLHRSAGGAMMSSNWHFLLDANSTGFGLHDAHWQEKPALQRKKARRAEAQPDPSGGEVESAE